MCRAVDRFSETLKDLTFTVDREWNAVLCAYKQHSDTLTVNSVCTATPVRPSIAEQMAAIDHLNRQLQIEYPCSSL